MPLTPLAGSLGVKRAAHLLRRACFGGSKTEIDQFASLTASEAVQLLFDNELPDVGYPLDPDTGTEWITTGATQNEEFQLRKFFRSWHLSQMVGNGAADSQKLSHIFRERLVFFFHTHFTTKSETVRSSRALYFQQALFRLFAFDQEDIIIPPVNPDAEPDDPDSQETIVPRNFKQLTKKLCVDNAMLIFLDGRYNVKGSPNENFARELLELYTIGRGLEGNLPEPEFDGDYFVFTEQDVQEGARVLSGFDIDLDFNSLENATLDEETGLPRGSVRGSLTNASQHDNDGKTFSSRLGGATIDADADLLNGTTPTEESVLDEISQFVDLIYEQSATPVAICREIYRFFVYHQVDQALQDDIIQDMADVFIANEFKIQPVLETLFTSTHFYEAEAVESDNNFGSIIKSPLDLVLGFIRNFEIPIPSHDQDLVTFYEYMEGLLGEISRQGMDYYEPFEVAGYSAYHQYPIFNRSWITTNYLTNRYNFVQAQISEVSAIETGQVDIVQFVTDNFSDVASNARDLVIAVIQYFLPVSENLSFDASTGELTVERLNYFKLAFLDDLDPDPEAAWTTRWTTGADPTTVARQLSNLFNAVLQSPEYQLM